MNLFVVDENKKKSVWQNDNNFCFVFVIIFSKIKAGQRDIFSWDGIRNKCSADYEEILYFLYAI